MANKLKNTAAFEACEKLYLNEEFADVHFVFKVDDEIQKVPANKANLAILSPVFRTMFFGSLIEKGDVPIADADADGFKEFLQVFYLGEVTLTMENIETVVRLADKYDVRECVKVCATFLKNQLTSDNMSWGYQLAMILKYDEIISFCEIEIMTSSKEIFSGNVFEGCDKSTLKRILELNATCMEVDVFDACLAWAKFACQKNGLDEMQAVNLKTQLGDCWKLIRFGSMNGDEFCKRYTSHKELFTQEEFEDIMLSLTSKNHHPRIFNRNPRYHEWDEANVLNCKRKTSNEGSRKYIKSSEVTLFSSNHLVFLGKIMTANTYICGESSIVVGIGVEVTITEQIDLTLHSNAPPKIVYNDTLNTSTWNGGQLTINLPQPIPIKPQRFYEIRLKLPITNGSYYYSDCQSMVEMADGIKIQFYRNPTLDYDNLAIGWIANLFFNKI